MVADRFYDNISVSSCLNQDVLVQGKYVNIGVRTLINLSLTSHTTPSILMSSMLNLYPKSTNWIFFSLVCFSPECLKPSKTISWPWTSSYRRSTWPGGYQGALSPNLRCSSGCGQRLYEAAYLLARRGGSLVRSSRHSVRDPERNGEQDKVLPHGSCFAARGSLTEPGSDLRPSCRRPLQCSPRTSDCSLHYLWLSVIWGTGIPSSLPKPETFSSDEQDAHHSSWWLQTRLHPQGVVSPMPPHWCPFSSSPWEGIRSQSSSPEGRWTVPEPSFSFISHSPCRQFWRVSPSQPSFIPL